MGEAHSSGAGGRGREPPGPFPWHLGLSPPQNITCSPPTEASAARAFLGSQPVSPPCGLGMGLKQSPPSSHALPPGVASPLLLRWETPRAPAPHYHPPGCGGKGVLMNNQGHSTHRHFQRVGALCQEETQEQMSVLLDHRTTGRWWCPIALSS